MGVLGQAGSNYSTTNYIFSSFDAAHQNTPLIWRCSSSPPPLSHCRTQCGPTGPTVGPPPGPRPGPVGPSSHSSLSLRNDSQQERSSRRGIEIPHKTGFYYSQGSESVATQPPPHATPTLPPHPSSSGSDTARSSSQSPTSGITFTSGGCQATRGERRRRETVGTRWKWRHQESRVVAKWGGGGWMA